MRDEEGTLAISTVTRGPLMFPVRRRTRPALMPLQVDALQGEEQTQHNKLGPDVEKTKTIVYDIILNNPFSPTFPYFIVFVF